MIKRDVTEKVRIGILGCANIAKKSAIKAFQALDNAEVISIASRNPQKAKEFASIFSIPLFQSYDELLNNSQVDAVYIPLPIGLHKEWTLKAVALGKHVLSEKSLTTDFQSTKEIVQKSQKAGVVLYENFMCSFHPQHQKVLSLINIKKIGETFLFRGYFGIPLIQENSFRYDKRLGGGSLNEAGAYPVFMARRIFNEEPICVDATLFHDKKKGIDMKGVAQLEFGNKKIAHIAFSLNSLYQNNYSLWGDRGLINVKRAYAIPPEMKPEIELISNDGLKEISTQINAPSANHFELIFKDFCNTILNKHKNSEKIHSQYENIISQAKVLQAIRVSSLESKRVWVKDIL